MVAPDRLTNLPPAPPLPERLCDVDRVVAVLTERGLDGLVSYCRPNVFYFTSYGGKSTTAHHEDNPLGAFVFSRHAPDHPILIMPEFDLGTLLARPTWVDDVRPYANVMLPLAFPADAAGFSRFVPDTVLGTDWGKAALANYAPDFPHALQGAIRDLGLDRGRVGFDNPRVAGIVDTGTAEIVDAFSTAKYIRQVKTPAEIEIMRHSSRINEIALEQTLVEWEPGVTWQELNHRYNCNALAAGGWVHDGGAIIFSNPPDGNPAFYTDDGITDFVIDRGMNLMFDCHGSWRNYAWDGGKTWFVGGEPDAMQAQVGKACSDALDAIRDAAEPGVSMSRLQQIGLDVMNRDLPRADTSTVFFHGLGLEHIDMEVVPGRTDWTLDAGMVLSAHIQYPGDVRERYFIEDIMHVRADGADRLFSWDNSPFEYGG